jgi:uncharacterized repeat protein (TIGR01451 family)/fimbrial isopeptide formation D2 family protein
MPARISRGRRLAAAFLAVALIVGGSVALDAVAAQAVAVGVSIQATNATTQKSGSEFDYQINLACSGTNSPTCDDAVLHIPLDQNNIPVGGVSMDDWTYDVSGGPTGFIQNVTVDKATHELVVTLAGSIDAGSSQSVILKVTPPNLTTYDGTTWSLLPMVTSTDPDMNGTTAPAAATGTATATVPLTVAKSAPQTFYREGDTFDYTLTATCPATPPVGSIDAASLVISDTVPDGLHIIATAPAGATVSGQLVTWTYDDPSEVPVACGGTAGTATSGTRTITVQVGSVGAGPGDEIAARAKLTNTVSATATPVGGGAAVQSSASRDVVILGTTDDPFPGNAGMNKIAGGPLNISATGKDLTGTYPGRWLPTGGSASAPASVTAAAPASYTLTSRADNNGLQYAIVDPLPCLTNHSGVSYSSLTAPAVCSAPAFHAIGITVQFGGQNPTSGYLPQYRDTSGVLHDMTNQTANGWVVPTGDLGNVAEIDVPRSAQQEGGNTATVKVLGYADSSLLNGDILTDTATTTWYVPATGAVAAAASHSADLHILDTAQIGITKKMADVGAVTGNRATLDLTGTLVVPSAADHDLVVSDLLPVGSTLVTAQNAVTGTLSWTGAPSPSSIAPALQVEVIPNYSGTQELVRVTLPSAQIPQEAGVFTLKVAQLTVTKPAAPGVYTNTARVFYDDADLTPSCVAGQYESLDPSGVRSDPAAGEVNCEADATFRTVTSASGQFNLVKTVQGDYDATPQQFPNVAHVKLTSGTAVYGIQWTNTGAPSLDGVVLYDVLPFVGDTGVSGAQAGAQRGTEFAPVLASVDAAPADVTIAYSASTDPCRPEVYPGQPAGCVNDWTIDPATLGGLANVAALRITSTASYDTGQGIAIGFNESVPTVSEDQIAWNSVAAFAKTTGGAALLPAESPKVGITASDHRLSIAKTGDVAAAGFGDTVTYTVKVGNVGTASSDPTTVSDHLPASLDFVSADRGGSYDAATRTVTWNVPALARDADTSFTVVVRVDAEQTTSTVTNSATLENPPGYSPPISADPCAADAAAACADLIVPITAHALAFTGVQVTLAAILVPSAAILAGMLLLLYRRRRLS